MVPAESPSVGRGAVRRPGAEATGPLRVLRDHRQHGDVAAVPARGGAAVAEMAVASASALADPVGSAQPAAEAVSTPGGAVRLGLTWRSERVTRRAGCLNRARPDLWEGWEATPTPTRPVFPH